jgi:hypothetical protein
MSLPKNPKDILKEVKAEISGVSPDEIVFSNLRNRKRGRKKKKYVESETDNVIINNQEGFGLIHAKVEVCQYDQIGKKKRLRKKNSLEEWGAFDFFLFTRHKYMERYGAEWDLNIGGSSLEINKIRDKFYDLFGFCCNLIMRDYINFFFDNYMDNIIKTEGNFYFSQMSNDNLVCEFYDGYNFPQRFAEYSQSEKKHNKDSINSQEIKQAFLIGDTSLVGNYGIVISLNWLIVVKKMSVQEAAKLIISACRDMHKKGMTDVVKKATELYSPYPSTLLFKQPQLVMDKIDKDIKLSVEFNKNDKLQFLQKRS